MNATTTVGTGFWANTQDAFHWSLAKGFDRVGSFDGSNDYIDTNSLQVTGYPFSLVARIRAVGTASSSQTVVFMGDSTASNSYARLDLTSNYDPSFTMFDGSAFDFADSNTDLNDGQWHTIVGVAESASSRKLIVDGVLIDTNTTTISPVFNKLAIGRSSDSSPSRSYRGDVAEVSVFDSALSVDEAVYIHTSGASGTNPGEAIHHYVLDQSTGTAIADRGTGSNNGTLNGDDGSNFWAKEIPTNVDGTSSVGRAAPSHPARIGHNGGATKIQRYSGLWAFNDVEAGDDSFHRTLQRDGADFAADRFIDFEEVLIDTNLTNLQTYVATKEI